MQKEVELRAPLLRASAGERSIFNEWAWNLPGRKLLCALCFVALGLWLTSSHPHHVSTQDVALTRSAKASQIPGLSCASDTEGSTPVSIEPTWLYNSWANSTEIIQRVVDAEARGWKRYVLPTMVYIAPCVAFIASGAVACLLNFATNVFVAFLDVKRDLVCSAFMSAGCVCPFMLFHLLSPALGVFIATLAATGLFVFVTVAMRTTWPDQGVSELLLTCAVTLHVEILFTFDASYGKHNTYRILSALPVLLASLAFGRRSAHVPGVIVMLYLVPMIYNLTFSYGLWICVTLFAVVSLFAYGEPDLSGLNGFTNSAIIVGAYKAWDMYKSSLALQFSEFQTPLVFPTVGQIMAMGPVERQDRDVFWITILGLKWFGLALCVKFWHLVLIRLPHMKNVKLDCRAKKEHNLLGVAILFLLYHWCHKALLFMLTEMALVKCWIDERSGYNYEIWNIWVNWLILVLNVTCIVKYTRNIGKPLTDSSLAIFMLLLPGWGADVHLLKDWMFIGTTSQLSHQNLGSWKAVFFATIALLSILVLFLPSAVFLLKYRHRLEVAANFIYSHWPPVGASIKTADRTDSPDITEQRYWQELMIQQIISQTTPWHLDYLYACEVPQLVFEVLVGWLSHLQGVIVVLILVTALKIIAMIILAVELPRLVRQLQSVKHLKNFCISHGLQASYFVEELCCPIFETWIRLSVQVQSVDEIYSIFMKCAGSLKCLNGDMARTPSEKNIRVILERECGFISVQQWNSLMDKINVSQAMMQWLFELEFFAFLEDLLPFGAQVYNAFGALVWNVDDMYDLLIKCADAMKYFPVAMACIPPKEDLYRSLQQTGVLNKDTSYFHVHMCIPPKEDLYGSLQQTGVLDKDTSYFPVHMDSIHKKMMHPLLELKFFVIDASQAAELSSKMCSKPMLTQALTARKYKYYMDTLVDETWLVDGREYQFGDLGNLCMEPEKGKLYNQILSEIRATCCEQEQQAIPKDEEPQIEC